MKRLLLISLIFIAACGSGSGTSSSSGFAGAALTFQTEKGLSDEWYSWLISRQSYYLEAYNRGRGDRTVRVEISYDSDIAWDSEEEHFAALKTLAELQFPGWSFTFSASDSDADVRAVLGYTGVSSYANLSTDTIYLIYEGIFAHELGHILGLYHHYCGNDVSTPCSESPPDEGKCIMGRSAASWGPTEQFLLNLTGESDEDAILSQMGYIYTNSYP